MAKRFKTDNPISENGNHDSDNINTESQNQGNTMNTFSHMTPPIKSFSDIKEYSVIQLANGLRALLISDKSENVLDDSNEVFAGSSFNEMSESESESSSEEDDDELSDDSSNSNEDKSKNKEIKEKLAACALSVGVGSFSDPENIPGLAHFLEHMIFMGSQKFPKENAFDAYIKKKGGSDNAFTECEFTNFYFDCDEEYLQNAMEIFSELFVSPLMKRDTMTKEREAIQSEFQMALPSDSSRRSQLFCSLADKSNPAHKFMWGNLITLRDNITDNDLYKAVHEFRKRHYSAHRMTLAVQARLPIETLEKLVVDCFKNVQNNGLQPDIFHLSVPPFRQDEFSKIYIIEPVKDINHLYLTWVMPSTLKMYKTKPLRYLSWVIGHEGKGSLHSYLKRKLWSIGINVSDGGDGTEDNMLFTLFSIQLILTEEGVKHIDEILDYLFLYLKMFQEKGPQERLFNEMQSIAETKFRYAEEVSSSDNVQQLAENMHFYPSSDYITGSELYFEYDPELINSFLMQLKPDNVNIMISSKIIASSVILDKVEPWFGTKYQCKDIPPTWLTKWKSDMGNHNCHSHQNNEVIATKCKSVSTLEQTEDVLITVCSCGYENPNFHLPEKNMFIATDFTILSTPEHIEDFPINIVKDDHIELWYKQDDTFKLPHAFCCLHLVSPLCYKTAQNAAMLDLLIIILKQHLSEELYPANVAELGYSFDSGEKGMVITINGFNDRLKKLLLVIIDGIKSLLDSVPDDMGRAMINELRRSYSNSNLRPSFLARDIRMSILLETYWTSLEKDISLNDVTIEQFSLFIHDYMQHIYVQCLIQGNISKAEAIDFSILVKDGLKYKPLLDGTAPKIRVRELPHGERFCVVHSFNTEDANSIVTNYYQVGLGTIREHCIIEFLLMMMEEPLFDSLRTQRQLGYDVSCTLRDTFGILGFSIQVRCQTNHYSTDEVESCITQFLHDFLNILKLVSDEEVDEFRESLVKLKLCKHIHLQEEVKRNWDEIKSEEYVFDRHLKEKDIIENLTLQEITKFFVDKTGIESQCNLKKLSIQVVGDDSTYNETYSRPQALHFLPQQNLSDKYVMNVTNLKKSLSLYPVHKII